MDKDNLKLLIAQARLDEAVAQLLEQIKAYTPISKSDKSVGKLSDILIINSGKLHGLQHDKMLGILDLQKEMVTLAQVQQAILYVLDELPDEFWNVPPQHPTAKQNSGNEQTRLLESVESLEQGQSNVFEFDHFVSSSSIDREFLQPVVEKLRGYGLRVFISDQNLKNYVGILFSETIQNALENSQHFVLVSSPNSAKSGWVTYEAETFFNKFHVNDRKNRRLFVLKGNSFDLKYVPLFFQNIQIAENAEQIVNVLVAETKAQQQQRQIKVMEDLFIKKIKINKVRHLHDIEIPISELGRKHLIVTGRNGSGKTSLLNSIRTNLVTIQNNQLLQIIKWKQDIQSWKHNINNYEIQLQSSKDEQEIIGIRNKIANTYNLIKETEQQIAPYSDIELELNNLEFIQTEYNNGNYIISFFDAKRSTQYIAPNGIKKLELKPIYQIEEKANQIFIQYLANLKAQSSFARDANNMVVVEEINNWFITFENYLKEIFEDDSLVLEFDSQNFDFNILQKNKEKFNLKTLSDGYSSILNIITELIVRMEKKSYRIYELQGIVLIDEIETHLHIELQKLILPFLIKVFPKIQFIVTTHSPFILNSVNNAVIYDLENKLLVSDLSGFSVEGIIEGYFNADKYSVILKQLVDEYEVLSLKKQCTENESHRFLELKNYFKELSKFFAPELELKIQQIELSKLTAK